MEIVITGGGGFLGRRLARRLLDRGQIDNQTIDRIVLVDLLPIEGFDDEPRIDCWIGDFAKPAGLKTAISSQTRIVVHLAAVVSGAAEQDFDLGMQVNLNNSLTLFEYCRAMKTKPKLLFASSVAVYGAYLPEVVSDQTLLAPQNSYGVQKAIVELLLGDYTRKGFVDGRSVRLPTVVVRPGKPNAAASSFASGIIREPLNGQVSICPVEPETELWIMSPARVIDAIIHALELPASDWLPAAGLALPGLTVSVRQMVDALERIAGAEVAARVQWRNDPTIESIVGGWAVRFDPRRALALGFQADQSIDEIIQAYVAQDFSGQTN